MRFKAAFALSELFFNSEEHQYEWEPRESTEAQCKAQSKVKSLKNYMLETIVEYIQDVASLQGIPDSIKVCILGALLSLIII